MVDVGQQAPDFELIDTELKFRKLEEFKGKKVDQILNSINLDMLTELGSKVIELSGLDSDDDGDEKKS